MEINNIFTQTNPTFKSLKVSKKTIKNMINNGDYDDFKKTLPELKRRAERANITIAGDAYYKDGFVVIYDCKINPKNTLLNNPVTRILGFKNFKYSGFSKIIVRKHSDKQRMFSYIYDKAYKDYRNNINEDIKNSSFGSIF